MPANGAAAGGTRETGGFGCAAGAAETGDAGVEVEVAGAAGAAGFVSFVFIMGFSCDVAWATSHLERIGGASVTV